MKRAILVLMVLTLALTVPAVAATPKVPKLVCFHIQHWLGRWRCGASDLQVHEHCGHLGREGEAVLGQWGTSLGYRYR